jgi:hypothetical protein
VNIVHKQGASLLIPRLESAPYLLIKNLCIEPLCQMMRGVPGFPLKA